VYLIINNDYYALSYDIYIVQYKVNKINNFYKFYFVPPILVLLYLKFNKYKNQPKEGGKKQVKEDILKMYFEEHMKQKDIADILNVTAQYISKVVAKDNRYLDEKSLRHKESKNIIKNTIQHTKENMINLLKRIMIN